MPDPMVAVLEKSRIQSVEMAVQAGLVRFVGEKNFKMDKDLKAKDPVCPCELLPHFERMQARLCSPCVSLG